MMKCVQLTNMQITSFNPQLGQCGITTTMAATIGNPTNFQITIESMFYAVYFNNTDGVGCSPLGVCVYYPEDNVLMANIAEPGPNPPIQNPLPVTMLPNGRTVASIRFAMNSTEQCLRVASEFSKNKLYVDVKDGLIAVDIYNFQVNITFVLYNYYVSPLPPACAKP